MSKDALPKWQTTASRYIVSDRWLKLRADSCITLDGHTLDPWYVLEYPEWANCLTIDKDGQVILLRHYRHGVDDYVTEIIGGNMDPEDETPEVTIAKELQEETGYEGGEIYKTGTTYANPSNQNNNLHTFLAVGGVMTQNTIKEIGADFVVETVPFKDWVRTITTPNAGATYQSLHITSIFFALNFIRQTNIESPAIRKLREALQESLE